MEPNSFETHLRFILDDSALYLTDKCESETVDLRRGTVAHSSKHIVLIRSLFHV